MTSRLATIITPSPSLSIATAAAASRGTTTEKQPSTLSILAAAAAAASTAVVAARKPSSQPLLQQRWTTHTTSAPDARAANNNILVTSRFDPHPPTLKKAETLTASDCDWYFSQESYSEDDAESHETHPSSSSSSSDVSSINNNSRLGISSRSEKQKVHQQQLELERLDQLVTSFSWNNSRRQEEERYYYTAEEKSIGDFYYYHSDIDQQRQHRSIRFCKDPPTLRTFILDNYRTASNSSNNNNNNPVVDVVPEFLENVTELSRSLIPEELFTYQRTSTAAKNRRKGNHSKNNNNKTHRSFQRIMSSKPRGVGLGAGFRKRISGSKKLKENNTKTGGVGGGDDRDENDALGARQQAAAQPQPPPPPPPPPNGGSGGGNNSHDVLQERGGGGGGEPLDADRPHSPMRRSHSVSQSDGHGSPSKRGSGGGSSGGRPTGARRSHSASAPPLDDNSNSAATGEEIDSSSGGGGGESGRRGRESRGGGSGRGGGAGGVFQRIRDRSRSRSRSRSRKEPSAAGHSDNTEHKEMLVAVTSCRSDGYYNQKAPGSTFKLPRKAPTNLKLFHELAVGVKDAYAAVGETPRKPTEEESRSLSPEEADGRKALWDFVGNLDFLLALVDEVAVDSVTRGALKDDSTFKGLRDVIKKGNRVLEEMLVRRERKYTLFFRLVQPHDTVRTERIHNWNMKVEKAVGAVTDDRDRLLSASATSDSESDATSVSSSAGSSVSSRAGVFSRGRQLLPTAGRVRSRRATPTPRLRRRRSNESDNGSDSAADGFSTVTTPNDLSQHSAGEDGELLPSGLRGISSGPELSSKMVVMQPKDELVDVIRGLRVEKINKKEANADDELAQLKPNWLPKADVPSSVPKLPVEYVHRHRLMKQVVSCLLGGPDGEQRTGNHVITCVTSRHGDKAGNGKSTLAVAVIQTVEVRERFVDGIAWLKLGRAALSDRDIRRLYEELYRQLIVKEADMEATVSDADNTMNFHESMGSLQSETRIDRTVERADSVRRFQGGDLEGIKEDLGRMLAHRKILICLDDVWRVDDAKWFIFEDASYAPATANESPYKVLITTRVPTLLGSGAVQEVFVRILSEHEAVKLLLSTAGRRPYGGRSSMVFNQSKSVVKGCGNSPLGILLVGSMLRNNNRNWNLKSPVWTGIFNQCTLNLEEAAQLRSFKNTLTRIGDASFFTVENVYTRIALRRCFVLFAMAFRTNDWMLSGRGIPQSVLFKFFANVIRAGPKGDKQLDPAVALSTLENLKLVQRAGHSVSPRTSKVEDNDPSDSSHGKDSGDNEMDDWDDFDDLPKRPVQQYYIMHDSLRAVAELMAQRKLPAFTPEDDHFNFFTDCIGEENRIVASNNEAGWTAPLRFLAQHLSSQPNGSKTVYLSEEAAHELVAVSLVGGGDGKALTKSSVADAMKANQLSMKGMEGGDKFEEYTMAFLPEHLMQSKQFASAVDLLTDNDFVRRRVFALGIMDATGRQVADIMDLRSFVGKGASARKNTPTSPARSIDRAASEEGGDGSGGRPALSFDLDAAVCDSSRIIIDEVYKVTNSMGQSDSLGMATCLATVGEALLKSRQPRDAMLRLEEAVSIYRGLLGPYHVFVAHALHSVAKALTKLGETRVALLKFAEAARIYEECNATLHYDSIANAQALASLLVDIGDVRKAESMFEEVISMKQAVYGEFSVHVAKTINSYAILLAKHGRTEDAMKNYELARTTYGRAPHPLIHDPEFEVKCSYDVTLITLNIASIYSKKGDLEKALGCYIDGVRGLEEYDEEMGKIRESHGLKDNSYKSSSHKHLVAALGRIGSLKLKLGDNDGALEAYLSLIDHVEEDSPIPSHIEEAKAHIKCATIFRQRHGDKNREESVLQLREALRMYKALYGPDHKDTTAIATSLKQWLAEDKS